MASSRHHQLPPCHLDPASSHAVLDALLRRDLFATLRTDEQLAALERGAVGVTTKPYGLLLCRLLGYDPRLDEDEARAYWHEVVTHRGQMSERLARTVHLRVAALDLVMTGRIPAGAGTPILVGPQVLASALSASSRDPATGLKTREAFFASTERLFRRPRPSVVALVIGLHGLEVLHDLEAHAAGGVVLARLGGLVEERMPDAIVGRISASEIGVALVDTSGCASRCVGALCCELEGVAASLGLDVVVGSARDGLGDTVATLLARADVAMAAARRARRAGRAPEVARGDAGGA